MKKSQNNFWFNKIKKLERINERLLHLSANENILSDMAHRMISSRLAERYFFGGASNRSLHIGNASFFGLNEVAQIEKYAKKILISRLGAAESNLNCLSGIHAMMCSLLACTHPGDTVMTIKEKDGGHFATQGIINAIGRKQIYANYINKRNEFDIQTTANKFIKSKARLLYLDNSNQIKPINIKALRDAIGKKAIIIYDASHTLGLILTKGFPNPFDLGADIITANTHKTLPGPQKGLIIYKNRKMGDRINKKINSCLVSSVHTHHLLALCVSIIEMVKFGSNYGIKVVRNSNVLAEEMSRYGFNIRRADNKKYTYNHQVHVFLPKNLSYRECFKRLVQNNISTNIERNILGDKHFIRLGTQEVTRMGMSEKEMKEIASILYNAIMGKNVIKQISNLKNKFKKIKFSFDN